MAVAVIATDTWLSHLEFTGGRRETDFGPIDGLFYGVVSGVGDSSSGNFTLNGLVSFDRKEDWIYILKAVSYTRNDVTSGDDTFIVAATGPIIPTGSAVANASFHYGGVPAPIAANAVTVLNLNSGGPNPLLDIPIFGDKRIAGPLALIACGAFSNTDTVTYQLSVYGHLIRYASFFRNVNPSRG